MRNPRRSPASCLALLVGLALALLATACDKKADESSGPLVVKKGDHDFQVSKKLAQTIADSSLGLFDDGRIIPNSNSDGSAGGLSVRDRKAGGFIELMEIPDDSTIIAVDDLGPEDFDLKEIGKRLLSGNPVKLTIEPFPGDPFVNTYTLAK